MPAVGAELSPQSTVAEVIVTPAEERISAKTSDDTSPAGAVGTGAAPPVPDATGPNGSATSGLATSVGPGPGSGAADRSSRSIWPGKACVSQRSPSGSSVTPEADASAGSVESVDTVPSGLSRSSEAVVGYEEWSWVRKSMPSGPLSKFDETLAGTAIRVIAPPGATLTRNEDRLAPYIKVGPNCA